MVSEDSEELYEVERVEKAKVHKVGSRKEWRYLVKWKGYPSEENTWELSTAFQGDAVENFWKEAETNGRIPTDLTKWQHREEVGLKQSESDVIYIKKPTKRKAEQSPSPHPETARAHAPRSASLKKSAEPKAERHSFLHPDAVGMKTLSSDEPSVRPSRKLRSRLVSLDSANNEADEGKKGLRTAVLSAVSTVSPPPAKQAKKTHRNRSRELNRPEEAGKWFPHISYDHSDCEYSITSARSLKARARP
ncbi:hypothetical protein FIBSPDRAFT_1048697 [Athelia psychrophila]|uniref:Chromo domain-containing protein n=1 Tax=Athelia psychrophila TaxID=1759441 RepID=A0A166DD39_9AGAM|nr:hypothetical protein FIBSPDRAFT_1048697 [Fibularhizoctonia sp. CBS 109695]